MIEVFAAFRKWCDQNMIPADQIQLNIVPLSADAAARFTNAWRNEMAARRQYPDNYELHVTGDCFGVPFEYKGFTPPFGA